jgi:valyl-tRNA synthetase
MALSKRYQPAEVEPRIQARWQAGGVYHFEVDAGRPAYLVDTPPPTVSGHLHLGHVFSYSHPDFMVRFFRMYGYNVLYPMGYDDNGLPTERLVERRLGIRATEVGREPFIQKCLEISEEVEQQYEALWRRLGLSVDWRYRYRTIDDASRRLSQLSFLDLARRNLAYRRRAPVIWCPECHTAIAQADVAELERQSEVVTLKFRLEDGGTLAIATTRPELLPACVAVFVHPHDPRHAALVGRKATVPVFGQQVPILADPEADPEKGTGAVMCCTFGDAADLTWYYGHNLDLVEAIDSHGRMTEAAGGYAGLPVAEARARIKSDLEQLALLSDRQTILQTVRVHDRCDTPVEYIVAQQWFIRVLEFKEELLALGEQVKWYPDHMRVRYRQWVENLGWDWLISRQRFFGVPLPVWYCTECQEVRLAEESQLPVDPVGQQPADPCTCGSTEFQPETDVMDTWATSSLTPMLVGTYVQQGGFGGQPFESLSLRPQGHEIIRTWAFYSIVKAFHHFGKVPWHSVAISGWGLAPGGQGKISKSRGGGPASPHDMIERYSADALRYWAAGTSLGRDAIIDEARIQAGARLANKLWNVARFSERFLKASPAEGKEPDLRPADRWLLSRLQRLIARATELFLAFDHAAARSEIESFFWNELADNYLEMAKKRLYEPLDPGHRGAVYTLQQTLPAVLKLLAPFLPHVTEEIFLNLFAPDQAEASIHRSTWPEADGQLMDADAEAAGEALVQIATAVRRYKSQQSLSLSAELPELLIIAGNVSLTRQLSAAENDLLSVSRARAVRLVDTLPPSAEILFSDEGLALALPRGFATTGPGE